MGISQFSRNSSVYFSYAVNLTFSNNIANLNFSVYQYTSKNVKYFVDVHCLLYPHILIYKLHNKFSQNNYRNPLISTKIDLQITIQFEGHFVLHF